jgi:hypothetical protein
MLSLLVLPGADDDRDYALGRRTGGAQQVGFAWRSVTGGAIAAMLGLATDWSAQGRRSLDQGPYTDSSVRPSLAAISG